MKAKIKKSEQEWKKTLSPEEFEVLRKKGTESPFSGKYLNNKNKGIYVCSACGNELFSSESKFDSGSGWPSFFNSFSKDSVELRPDNSYNMNRIEVICSRCESHLGHVFNDGPKPSGLRYCINSISLNFKEKKE